MSASAVVTRSVDQRSADLDLVKAVRAGDDRAFELLYRRYQSRIAAYVLGMARDHGRAEDITQEVFIAALRRMRETERPIAFKPWIYEIARNACIDAFRRARTASEVSFDAHDGLAPSDQGRLVAPGAAPDAAVDTKLAIDSLCGAFGGLSQTHHDILVMREFEGLSYREIGERLGMSRAAVESTLFRARRRLSEEYEELVSGERCVRVRKLVDARGGRTAGARDRRRMARHLSHCQPCRRYAYGAGADLEPVTTRPASVAARIAGWLPLPLPVFARKRFDDAASPLLGQHASAAYWPANVFTGLDPAIVSSWSKAAATAVTVAVAGVGAGAVGDRAIRLATSPPRVADAAQAGRGAVMSSRMSTTGGSAHAPATRDAARRLAAGPTAAISPRRGQAVPAGHAPGDEGRSNGLDAPDAASRAPAAPQAPALAGVSGTAPPASDQPLRDRPVALPGTSGGRPGPGLGGSHGGEADPGSAVPDLAGSVVGGVEAAVGDGADGASGATNVEPAAGAIGGGSADVVAGAPASDAVEALTSAVDGALAGGRAGAR